MQTHHALAHVFVISPQRLHGFGWGLPEQVGKPLAAGCGAMAVQNSVVSAQRARRAPCLAVRGYSVGLGCRCSSTSAIKAVAVDVPPIRSTGVPRTCQRHHVGLGTILDGDFDLHGSRLQSSMSRFRQR
jgi:hypothetical protein